MKAKERKKKSYKVRWFKQTSSCCPSQWEGKLKDDRMFYVRYRWGVLTVDVSDNPTNLVKDCFEKGKEVLYQQIADGFDRKLSEEQMIEILENNNFKF